MNKHEITQVLQGTCREYTVPRITTGAHGTLNCPEIHTSGGEISGIEKKLEDDMSADLAHSQKADEQERKTDHAPLDAAKKREIVTVTIQTNLRQGEAEEKEEVVTLTAIVEMIFLTGRPRDRDGRHKGATRCCRREEEEGQVFFFSQNGAVAGLRKRRQQHVWTCSQPKRDFSLFLC